MTRIGVVFLLLMSLLNLRTPGVFSDAERSKIMAYWNAPGRYRINAPSTPGTNWPWVVRLTPEASLWFWQYDRARGYGKTSPTSVAGAGDSRWDEWEKWINAKLAFDRWNAAVAAAANASGVPVIGAPPPHPGPIPSGLLEIAGNPPEFAAAVAPLDYVVSFDTGEKITYTDHPEVPVRYAYYRFGQGVRNFGTPLRSIRNSELDAAFSAAGMSSFERRVARAVSMLEGGFESINTYDTGFLSVGFIQFATLEPGSGSLGAVLSSEKENDPGAFEKDFRRFGIDVTTAGALVVLDSGTGAELAGNAAVRKIIDDKRLTAVFQLAGSRSKEFRSAQIRVMKQRYYPAHDGLTLELGGRTITGRVLDVVKSEAGMATLFDRKVNRGNIEPLTSILAGVMEKYQLGSFAEAAAYEREIVAALRYRHDFLADASLGQPPALPAPKAAASAPKEEPNSVKTKTESEREKPDRAAVPPPQKSGLPDADGKQNEEAVEPPAAPVEPEIGPRHSTTNAGPPGVNERGPVPPPNLRTP